MTTALQIITSALQGINVLGANETIAAADANYCLNELNIIADNFNAGRYDLFKDTFVSGTVTGQTLTTSTGAFASVTTGIEIQGMLADNYTMSVISIEQYRDIFNKAASGRPLNYAYDGANTIYLYPAAINNVMTIQSRGSIANFADLATNYIFPSGYLNAFIANLQVVIAMAYKGTVSPSLLKKQFAAMQMIESSNIRPVILDNQPLKQTKFNILTGTR